MEHAKLRLKLERRSSVGFGYDLGYSVQGKKYNPELGFELRDNVTRFGNRIWWGWLPGQNSPLYSHEVYISGSAFHRNSDWSVESAKAGVGWRFQAKNTWGGDFSLQHFVEDVSDTFEIGSAEIPPGNYAFDGFITQFNTPYSGALSFLVSSYVGTFYDGKALTLAVNPVWSPSSGFEIGLRYEYNQGEFSERDQSYRIHLTGFKTKFMFTNALSLSLFVQYNSDVEEVFTNLRIRYNPKEGNDLYIVYNDNMPTNRYREIPTLPISILRTFVVKYTYTFTWNR